MHRFCLREHHNFGADRSITWDNSPLHWRLDCIEEKKSRCLYFRFFPSICRWINWIPLHLMLRVCGKFPLWIISEIPSKWFDLNTPSLCTILWCFRWKGESSGFVACCGGNMYDSHFYSLNNCISVYFLSIYLFWMDLMLQLVEKIFLAIYCLENLFNLFCLQNWPNYVILVKAQLVSLTVKSA